MKSVLVLVAVAMLVPGTLAWVGTQILSAHPEHPNKCYEPRTKEAHPVGDVWHKSGHCVRKSCDRLGEEYHISIVGCGSAWHPPGCRLESDLTKPFPKCCPQIVC